MQVLGSDNAGPGSDIFGLELMSERKETFLEKMKANGTIFELNFIWSQIFISEWTLYLRCAELSTAKTQHVNFSYFIPILKSRTVFYAFLTNRFFLATVTFLLTVLCPILTVFTLGASGCKKCF